jgi:hypothetical protein
VKSKTQSAGCRKGKNHHILRFFKRQPLMGFPAKGRNRRRQGYGGQVGRMGRMRTFVIGASSFLGELDFVVRHCVTILSSIGFDNGATQL